MTAIETKSLKVGKYVDTNHVDTVIKEYKKEKWSYNSERLGKDDSMSSWYSVEELEEFLANAKSHGANGIRFYFAAYPHDFAGDPEYRGRQTIVMVANKQKETLSGTVNKDIYIADETGNTSILAYNFGRLCPPYNCGTGGKGTTGIEGDSEWGDIGTTLVDRGNAGIHIV